MGTEAIGYAAGFTKLVTLCNDKTAKTEDIQKKVDTCRQITKSFFKDYYQPIDKKTFTSLIKIVVNEMEPKYLPPVLSDLTNKYKGDYTLMANKIF